MIIRQTMHFKSDHFFITPFRQIFFPRKTIPFLLFRDPLTAYEQMICKKMAKKMAGTNL